jgi:ribosomal protein S18 acetylase RimI-like enzyme
VRPLEVRILVGDELEQLEVFLGSHPVGPFTYMADEPGTGLLAFWLGQLRALSELPDGLVMAALSAGKVVGLVACGSSPWESRVLGHRFATLAYLAAATETEGVEVLRRLLHELETRARDSGVEVLVAKPCSDTLDVVRVLQGVGYTLVDSIVEYVADLRGGTVQAAVEGPPTEGTTLRPAQPEDVTALRSVARAAFERHFGRFHADARIEPSRARAVYEEWISACCGGYADAVILAEVDGVVRGYSAWRRPTEPELSSGLRLGHYSIGAVHPECIGRRVFQSVTAEGMRWMRAHADLVEGPTHTANYSVQRAYAKLGWVCRRARYSFHKWLESR